MDWVAVDTETTGLGAEARLVEIGARRYYADGTAWDFETLVDPGVPIPLAVRRIHGISDDMVAGAPDARTALRRFFTFAEGAALVAHNAAFDARMLMQDAARAGLVLPPAPVHDTLRLARRIVPHLWSYRLPSVARVLRIPSPVFHRALPDAVVVGELTRRLLRMRPVGLLGFPFSSAGLLGPLTGFRPRPERVPGVAAMTGGLPSP